MRRRLPSANRLDTSGDKKMPRDCRTVLASVKALREMFRSVVT